MNVMEKIIASVRRYIHPHRGHEASTMPDNIREASHDLNNSVAKLQYAAQQVTKDANRLFILARHMRSDWDG